MPPDNMLKYLPLLVMFFVLTENNVLSLRMKLPTVHIVMDFREVVGLFLVPWNFLFKNNIHIAICPLVNIVLGTDTL